MHMSFKRYFFNAIISDSARKNAEKIISAQSAKKKGYGYRRFSAQANRCDGFVSTFSVNSYFHHSTFCTGKFLCVHRIRSRFKCFRHRLTNGKFERLHFQKQTHAKDTATQKQVQGTPFLGDIGIRATHTLRHISQNRKERQIRESQRGNFGTS